MLPGLGLKPRRKIVNHYRLENPLNNREPFLREEIESSSIATVSTRDETAIKARKRLEEKFSHLYLDVRTNKHQADEGRGNNNSPQADEPSLGSKLLMRLWNHPLSRYNPALRKTCPVCLEDFQAEQNTMDLSCSHRFHSSCLLPWLEAHPHCPYCRTPVLS